MKSLLHGLVLALLVLASFGFAQEDDPEKLSEEEKAKRAQELMALMGPGPEHELLLSRVGSWNLSVKIWPHPGARQPMVMTGTSTYRPILGNRFVVAEGESFDPSGRFPGKSENFNILGFDRRHGHYTLTGYDTFGTYGVSATGTYDEESKTLTLSGEDHDPILKVTQRYDFVFHFKSDDEHVMSIIFKDRSHGNTEPFKMVEVTATRVKKEK